MDTARHNEHIVQLQVEVDFLKKSLAKPVEEKRAMIEPDHSHLSISRQYQLVGLCRSVFYYQPAQPSEDSLRLIELFDFLFPMPGLIFFGFANEADKCRCRKTSRR